MNSKDIPIKSMPSDSLDFVSDPAILERSKARLRVCDAADTVSSKLTVLCALLDSDKYQELDDNDRYCAQRLIYDTLQECIDLLRVSKEV